MELCKVRYDGYHTLVQPYENKTLYSTETIINSDLEELGLEHLEKKDLFINRWAEANFPNKGDRTPAKYYKRLNDRLIEFYNDLISKSLSLEELKQYLYDYAIADSELIKLYSLDNTSMQNKLLIYIKDFIDRQIINLKSRKRLFRRKALSNDWNYFATFTYDDKKHTEETFVKTLKKKLQNLHTNYGWLYMGCFERSKKDRLHFHGLLYVPKGTMRGNICETEYYDTNSHKKAVCYINSEFEDKIGRNDFKSITTNDFTFTTALEYILKYIGKSNNRVVYSRGIKDDIFALVDYEENVICRVNENSPYFILGEETEIIELTKDLNYAKKDKI